LVTKLKEYLRGYVHSVSIIGYN